MLEQVKQGVEEKKEYLAPKLKKYGLQAKDVLSNASQQGSGVGDSNYDVTQDDNF